MSLTPDEYRNVRLTVAEHLPDAADAFAQALDDMLSRAQERFGPRDGEYMVSRIVFGDTYPKVSYPWRPAKAVSIRLSEGALRWARGGYPKYALWQLAHEAVHLLSPTPGERVSVLEEGLACCFQDDYMWDRHQHTEARTCYESFLQAEALTRRLLALNPQAVRLLRLSQPTISRITAGALRRQCPDLPEEEVEALTSRFRRGYAPLADGSPWPFPDPPTLAVEATQGIADGGEPILLVCHDEDGGWRFLGVAPASDEETVVSLREIVTRDPSVCALADLPLGSIAWRDAPNAAWHILGSA